jgi:hypothetical protein
MPHMYICCSKKACWLCYHFLISYQSKYQRPYLTNGSHGHVYPKWNTTIFSLDENSATRMSLEAVMQKMYDVLGQQVSYHAWTAHDTGSDFTTSANSTPGLHHAGFEATGSLRSILVDASAGLVATVRRFSLGYA